MSGGDAFRYGATKGNASGCFYWAESGSDSTIVVSDTKMPDQQQYLSATLSNPIFGKSNTNQPESIRVLLLIRF